MEDWRRVKKFWDWERWWDCDDDDDGSEESGVSCAGRVEVDAVIEDDAEDVDEGPATEASPASPDNSEPPSLVVVEDSPVVVVFSAAVSFVSSCCACAT